jgi:hypothetical protein
VPNPAACANDGACGAGSICVNASCRGGCRNDNGCDGAQTCNAMSLTCVEPMMCNGDVDCLGDRVCRQNFCQDVIACANDNDCGPGFRCNAQTQSCEPFFGCVDAADCARGFTCTQNVCVENQVCAANADCAVDRVCEAQRCTAIRCAGLATLRNGVAVNGALVAGVSDFDLVCDPANGLGSSDEAYTFTLAAPARVDFDTGGVAVFLTVGRTCNTPEMVACDDGADFAPVELPAGTYFVSVTGADGATGNFSLTLRVQ